VYRLIRTGQVRINGKRCKPASRVREGDQIRIPPARVNKRGEVHISADVMKQVRDRIIHRDNDLLVVDKPAGMAVHAGSGLPWGLIDVLRRLFPGEFLELAHRLDRETSGCLALARNGAALGWLGGQFREGAAGKRYLCLMDGTFPESPLDVDAPLARVEAGGRRLVEVSSAGKPARTRFHRLQAYPGATYAEAELLTGRTHQIRVHARHLDMPLAGDRKYAPRDVLKRWRKRGLKRLFLHAHVLELATAGGGRLEFSTPLPPELGAVLSALE
jgi:23S rRNA pseudouridine955/2504/2580 synthase